MIAKKGYGRAFLQRGTPKIFDQLEMDVPYPRGQRVEMAKGGRTPAWQRKEGKSKSGGLNARGRASYNRSTGGNLRPPVTTKPSRLKKGSSAYNRRKSFCSRMQGMKRRLTSAKTANDPNSRINKALRKWNC